MNKLTFQLIHKDYAREYYESNTFMYEGKPVKAVVKMRYHTIRHYWGVALYFVYSEKFKYGTPTIKGASFLKFRKDARKIAKMIMESTTELTLQKLQKFYLDHIKEN